ncbi:P-loop containing nucleoside triphosphate hydrolase protein [Naviculisporaceae sp. PSN 640]
MDRSAQSLSLRSSFNQTTEADDESFIDDDLFDDVQEAHLITLEQYSDEHLFDDIDEDELAELERPVKRIKTEVKIKTEDSDDDALPTLPTRNPAHLELAERLLKENFGYKSFRHEQARAIQAILDGDNTLVIFPTGAGKSLCYQIPAIAFSELDKAEGTRPPHLTGITLVVSPLLALMKDQVDSLVRRGIAAESLDSGKSWAEIQAIYVKIRKSQLQLLYVAPERLSNELFLEHIRAVRGGIRLLAVDEAHCVSEWGHSFRPDYLKVARFVKDMNAERVIALTATATPKVALDIAGAFGIRESCIFRTSPYRPNLHLDAMTINFTRATSDPVMQYMNMVAGKSTDPETEQRFEELFCWLAAHPGPTLVYVAARRQTVEHAKVLNSFGFKAAPFHAQMKTEQKNKVQEEFMSGKIQIVCATIAFGMGIDKPDIRNVVHWDLSNSVEEYSQQIGRAGRDGKPSSCMFYLAPSAFYLREVFARGDVASRHSIHLLLEDILRLVRGKPVGSVVNVSHHSQGRDFDIMPNTMAAIYSTLELTFGLLRATTPEYVSCIFFVKPSYHSVMQRDPSPTMTALKQHARKLPKPGQYELNIRQAAAICGVSVIDLRKKLESLQEAGHIDVRVSGIEQRYFIVKAFPHSRQETDEIIDKIYANELAKERDYLERGQQVMDLITGSKCFALALADYFGMGLPDKEDGCGHCVFCETGKPVQMPRRPHGGPVTAATIQRILRVTPIRDDPRFLTRIAYGISSPRIKDEKLHLKKKGVFRSLLHYDFDVSLPPFLFRSKSQISVEIYVGF